MFQKLINWYKKRQDQQALRYAFELTRSILPGLTANGRCLLVSSMRQLIKDYDNTWGNSDGIAEFCREELHKIIVMNKKEGE